VSRALITSVSFVGLLLTGVAGANAPAGAGFAVPQTARSGEDARPSATSRDAKPVDLAPLFQRGQDALKQGRLDEAERDFRAVLAADSKAGEAYANLGVVSMRRKQWATALRQLKKAQQLMPEVAGVRLNIGLAYYRQNEFLQAIAPFESVVRDQPEAVQPRYLLGLCYFFADRWADATTMLEPLWAQESGELAYLYVLSNAAHRAGRKELDDRAAERLAKLGDGSAESHLFAGKYHLNRGENDLALADFQAAAMANAALPFVHFNLGLTYEKKQDYADAREEFLKDAAVEPDLALNYDQLGNVYWLTDDDRNAENSYREALRLDPRLLSSRLGLAKIYERQRKYGQALGQIDAASKVDTARPDVHYLRGRLLLQMGRKEEARKELAAAEQIENGAGQENKPDEGEVPAPELLEDSQ
jgi:tetratricopeptide (TPR) repeat protein